MYGLSQGHGLLSSKLMIAAWDVVSSKVCGRGVECESSEYWLREYDPVVLVAMDFQVYWSWVRAKYQHVDESWSSNSQTPA